MPRFVILEHDHPTLHWDLMFEVGAALWTWRLDAIPCPGTSVHATRIADHRTLYLDYEGPIGGNRGSVRRVAAGEFAWVEEPSDRIVVELRGPTITGILTLMGEEVSFGPAVTLTASSLPPASGHGW